MKSRREFLTLSGVTALYLLTGCGNSSSTKSGGNESGAGNTLPIPELMTATVKNGIHHYDLSIQEGVHSFFSGVDTKTWGINASYLGPTLLLNNGADVSINYTNRLPEETTMHGHGMHLPGNMDGTAHQPIAVGGTWSAQYQVNQRACTNWYHPHYIHKTAPHVYQGLAGLIIIQDDESQALDIPKRYGVDDIPLVLQDRVFSADKKSLLYAPNPMQVHDGYIGDTFLTNGAISPSFEAEAKEIRFRLLNGSNSSIYNLSFSNGIRFSQIATDNAFLESAVTLDNLTLSPGERAEIIVDLRDRMGENFILQENRYGQTFLQINVGMEATQTHNIPSVLTTIAPLATATRKRRFVLGMRMGGGMGNDNMDMGNSSMQDGGMGSGMNRFTINGKSMDMNRIDERMRLGEVEEWEIVNSSEADHNFHIHATHFRIISRNGSSAQVQPNEQGLKDVVFVPAGQRVNFVVQMTDVTADDANPYMFHCHFLEHEDNGMMGQFTVS